MSEGANQETGTPAGSIASAIMRTVQAGSGSLEARAGEVERSLKQSMHEVQRGETGANRDERMAFAIALANSGSHRRELTNVDSYELCRVAQCVATLGEGAERQEIEVKADFWLGRFPVTNEQFSAFENDLSYQDPSYWTAEGWAWLQTQPGTREAALKARQNHAYSTQPATLVNWFEAVAFCKWLDHRWRNAPRGWVSGDMQVRLPTEVEWETAARGGHLIPTRPDVRRPDDLRGLGVTWETFENPSPARRFAWGDVLTGEDGEVPAAAWLDDEMPMPVGCFPGGMSPYGCEDMCGNIWEWLNTRWGATWGEPGFGREPKIDGRDDTDGSDLRQVRGGCYRVGGDEALEHERHLQACYRTRSDPRTRHLTHGFRACVGPVLKP